MVNFGLTGLLVFVFSVKYFRRRYNGQFKKSTDDDGGGEHECEIHNK